MKKLKILQKPIIRNILSALAVAILGFILLNLAFLLDFLYQTLIRYILGLFIDMSFSQTSVLIPITLHGSYFLIILGISWWILNSKLNRIFKAAFLNVPLAVVFATIGMFLYQWQILVFLVGGLFFLSVLYYLYNSKKHWIYYYTLILISTTLTIFTLVGGEI